MTVTAAAVKDLAAGLQKKCRTVSSRTTPDGGWVLACNRCRTICPSRFDLAH